MTITRTSATNSLTVSQAIEVINLYATGCYSHRMTADLLSISEYLVWRVVSFRPPYDLIRDIVPAETVERLKWVAQENRLVGRGVAGKSRARWFKRLLSAGYSNTETARITGADYYAVWRIATGRTFAEIET